MLQFRTIFNIIGFLLILEGLLMLPGIPFSIYYNDDDIMTLLLSGLGISFVGFLLWFFTRSKEFTEIKKRDGYLIVALGWIIMSLFGSIPFILHGSIPNFIAAFFETASGFTTTGASILTNIEALPHGLLFWRSMTHWIGGMGIIVLSLAILPLLGIGGMQLYVAEVPGHTKDKIHPRVRETAKRLWGIYVLLTGVQTFLLLLGGMNLFDAICHSFGTIATGGFSTKNASLGHYQSAYIDYVVLLFMFLSGVNFTLHYFALRGKIKSYWSDEEFKFYLTLISAVAISIAAYLFLSNLYSLEESFRHSLFTVISLVTSTGFVTENYEIWGPFFSTLVFILLLTGACAGSTGGGVKMIRHYLLLKNGIYELKRLIHPNAIIPVRYNKKAVLPEIISKVSAFALFYLLILAVGSLFLSFTGMDFTSAVGSVAACVGNVGPGLAETGPVMNYSNVSSMGKILLAFIMVLGRLELFTVLIIFSTSFWKK
ncbi:MAG TPA: potassium transporter TrkG [Ignavibacteriaceae bacterium]|nr:potassium transporter TrkG [Ignavibacteriaceae bacterium]